MIYDLQKANFWKRISAFLLDIILLSIFSVGFALLISKVVGYDQKQQAYEKYIADTEEEYGIVFDITESEYNSYSEEEKAKYDAALAALNANDKAVGLYNILINLTLIMVTGGILLSYLILEFFIPLAFKNGQTLGKKVFGIALMRSDGVRINGPILFIRTILGKYAVETMIAAYILIMFFFGQADIFLVILFCLIPLSNIILLIATKTNSMIHDLLAKTVAVDFASQKIFDGPEDLIEYKTRIHREMVENQGETAFKAKLLSFDGQDYTNKNEGADQ